MIDAIRDYMAHGGIWVETGSASFYGTLWNDLPAYRFFKVEVMVP